VNLTEIVIDADSPVAGKTLKDIDLPVDALIAVVIRGDQPLTPRGATVILAGDHVVPITLPENHGPVLMALTGESIKGTQRAPA